MKSSPTIFSLFIFLPFEAKGKKVQDVFFWKEKQRQAYVPCITVYVRLHSFQLYCSHDLLCDGIYTSMLESFDRKRALTFKVGCAMMWKSYPCHTLFPTTHKQTDLLTHCRLCLLLVCARADSQHQRNNFVCIPEFWAEIIQNFSIRLDHDFLFELPCSLIKRSSNGLPMPCTGKPPVLTVS